MTFTTTDIPGYEGRAVRIDQGSTFRVIDVEGCQIADMFVISADDHREVFSPALTRQVIFRLTPKPGDVIYSNRRRPMLTFLNDSSPGRHDMAFAPCDPGFYVDLGADASHPNCRDNFYQAISKLEIKIEPPPDRKTANQWNTNILKLARSIAVITKSTNVNNFCKTCTLKQDNELNRHESIRSQCRITGSIRR